MNSLLAPAIALMNRLSYGMKFCLISVLFFIPLGIVSSMVVHQAYERVQMTRHAQQNLELVRASSAIVHDAEVIRDMEMSWIAFSIRARITVGERRIHGNSRCSR